MNNTEKQLPSPEEFDKSEYQLLKYGYILRGCQDLREYAKLIIPYILQQVAENGLVEGKSGTNEVSHKSWVTGHPHNSWNVSIDKQSILSLEEQIIKDLGL